MIKLENYEVLGWEHAIRGMRNPMNSWEKSDSDYADAWEDGAIVGKNYWDYEIGPNDHDLMMRLANGGPVHAKYRRMIVVYVDITAPLYWWKEFDTYKVGTVANSCSTMHKIHAKEFTLEDFSCEKLKTRQSHDVLKDTIGALNAIRDVYLNGGFLRHENGNMRCYGEKEKDIWYEMIQLLPSSYNQKRTIMFNYEVLHGMYHSRKNHKLDEWREFCAWIESLPYSEIITVKESE